MRKFYDNLLDHYKKDINIPNTLYSNQSLKTIKFLKTIPKKQRVDKNGYCIYNSERVSMLRDPYEHYKKHPYKKIKVRCPLCGRQLIAKVCFFDDERTFCIPKHKPKGTR